MTEIAYETPSSGVKQNSIAGFWRRSMAFWIDTIILGIVGGIVIMMLFNLLLQIGDWARLIGFLIGSAYFAVLEGCAGSNQSLGKYVMKIKVVRCVDGETSNLNLFQAWLRYLVIAVPAVLGGISFIDIQGLRNPELQWLWTVNGFALLCWVAIALYLLIFNVPSRKTLSDLLVSSIVVRVDAQAVRVAPIKQVHWTVISCAIVVLVSLGFVLNRFVTPKIPSELYVLQRATATVPGVATSSVWMGTTHKLGTSDSYAVTTITVSSSDPQRINDAGLTEVAKVAFAAFPQLSKQDHVGLIGVTAVNLGIAFWSSRYAVNLSPNEWAAKIANDHS